MKKLSTLLFAILFFTDSYGQFKVSGTLMDDNQVAVGFANVALYDAADNSLVKVEISDIDGNFVLANIPNGDYRLSATFIGYTDFTQNISISGEDLSLGQLTMASSTVELETATVTARRNMVEVKSDRTVFNVQGTINSAGDNALGLLRKAPGVLVDNNNNISVLSRSGVLVYVDGKRLPIEGDDLTAYLEGLQAEQIDRMDIITNPGAKYEAEGNAGIIDIRLKKQKGIGANGSLAVNGSQGRFARGNLTTSGNYRNATFNTFGTLGLADDKSYNEMYFANNQNGLFLDESNYSINESDRFNARWGTDFFIGNNHTVGFLVSTQSNDNRNNSENEVLLSQGSTPNQIDSILVADNTSNGERNQSTYNLNYVFSTKNTSLNVDLDYGRFRNTNFADQPNIYFNAERNAVLTEVLTEYQSPSDIDIYTAKVDYEKDFYGGRLGLGSKFSKVVTDNTFLFSDIINGESIQNNRRSNQFEYDEEVLAGYANYSRSLSQKFNMSAGLRVEQTNATGDLQSFLPELKEDPVVFDFVSFFPNAGLTYSHTPFHVFSLNYGRRINRPDYNVLNPFREQLSELSYSQGNAFLRPEIVNNYELGYTLNFRYNFKLSYSKTTDQITRLIGPDTQDPRAGYITWDNLSEQNLYNFTVSAPIQFNNWWNFFTNFSAGYIDNQADYGDGAIVDVQAFTYNMFMQNTFTLPYGFIGEISGWYSGPGVWGGVFEYDPSYSLNLGIQRKFFNKAMNVRLAANDITYQTGWSGTSEFNGLVGTGRGNWDSRRVSLSVSFNFGKSDVKSRKRKTGIEAESKRASGGS